MPAEAVETITVKAKNKEQARYNAVWAANMKCNRKGFWACLLYTSPSPRD